jgi:hypothetical protein
MNNTYKGYYKNFIDSLTRWSRDVSTYYTLMISCSFVELKYKIVLQALRLISTYTQLTSRYKTHITMNTKVPSTV